MPAAFGGNRGRIVSEVPGENFIVKTPKYVSSSLVRKPIRAKRCAGFLIDAGCAFFMDQTFLLEKKNAYLLAAKPDLLAAKPDWVPGGKRFRPGQSGCADTRIPRALA
jgi:hypothetical protein